MAKKHSDSIVPLKEQGIPYVAGSANAGLSLQYAVITQVGASPFAVTFAGLTGADGLPLSDMEDTNYAVQVNGPTGDEFGDPSTYTTTGFSITGSAASEVLRVLIIGRLKNQKV